MLTKNHYTYNSRNQTSIKNFIDTLFNKHAKLLPVRVDLGYKSNERVAIENQSLNNFNYLLDPTLPPHRYLTANEIMDNWNVLLNRLRWNHRHFLKDLVGYIWKIEYGESKGIHYHIMLFFNGNRVQKDYYYAVELGELWLNLTLGLGTYFNCSVDKQNRYGDKNCLRIFHREEDRNSLYDAAKYLTKIDDFEHIARELSGGRVLGRSC